MLLCMILTMHAFSETYHMLILEASFCIMIMQEFMEKLKMPSDAELMLIAIADLNNSSISLEDRLRALNELLILVEPIDNANGTCASNIAPFLWLIPC